MADEIEKKEESTEPDGEDFLEAFEKAPPIIKKEIATFFSQRTGSSHPMQTLFEKMNDEHLSIYLTGAQQDDNNTHTERQTNKLIIGIGLLLFAAILFVILLVPTVDKEFAREIIQMFGAFIAGGLGGYGFGTSKK